MVNTVLSVVKMEKAYRTEGAKVGRLEKGCVGGVCLYLASGFSKPLVIALFFSFASLLSSWRMAHIRCRHLKKFTYLMLNLSIKPSITDI